MVACLTAGLAISDNPAVAGAAVVVWATPDGIMVGRTTVGVINQQ